MHFVRDGSLQGLSCLPRDRGWCNATADCQLGVNYLRSYWPIEEYNAYIKGKIHILFL